MNLHIEAMESLNLILNLLIENTVLKIIIVNDSVCSDWNIKVFKLLITWIIRALETLHMLTTPELLECCVLKHHIHVRIEFGYLFIAVYKCVWPQVWASSLILSPSSFIMSLLPSASAENFIQRLLMLKILTQN